MKTMQRLAAAVAVAVTMLAAPAPAQAQASFNIVELPLISDYDIDSTTLTYCATTGRNGDRAAGSWRRGVGSVTTAGSATTVTGYPTNAPSFAGLAAGDEIVFVDEGVLERRYVTAVASATSITVNAAVNLSTTGTSFEWRKRVCGTAATDGWFPVRGWTAFTLQYQVDSLNATGGITTSLECRVFGATTLPVVQDSRTITSAGTPYQAVVTQPVDECRFGVKIVTADDGGDTGADIEKITAVVSGRR